MTVTTAPTQAQTPMRLTKKARKTWLVVHIASAGAWLGMDVVMGVLVFTALFTTDPATASLSYQALELFAPWPLLTVGIICLASGIVLGLGSKYGLIRYWWVAVKLVLTIVLCVLVVVLLRTGVQEAAEYGRTMTGPTPDSMIYPPIVSTMSVLFAIVISVFKPWGRRSKP